MKADEVLRSAALFTAAGVCEIGGGYLVWLWLRDQRGWALGMLNGLVLFPLRGADCWGKRERDRSGDAGPTARMRRVMELDPRRGLYVVRRRSLQQTPLDAGYWRCSTTPRERRGWVRSVLLAGMAETQELSQVPLNPKPGRGGGAILRNGQAGAVDLLDLPAAAAD